MSRSDHSASDSICSAIASRRLLELQYKGQLRLIEPYSHGFARSGQEMLVGFQRAGGSDSGHVEGWKAMAINRIESLVILDVAFIPSRDDYRVGGSKNIDEMHCEI